MALVQTRRLTKFKAPNGRRGGAIDRNNALKLLPLREVEAHNVTVGRAARIHSTFAESMMMQSAQPPLRSNHLLDEFAI